MIKIFAPEVLNEEGNSSLAAKILINDDEHNLFFSVSSEYESALCTERSDAFVLASLIVAMRDGHDIVYDAPLSPRLYYQLEYGLIDFLVRTHADRRFRRINLTGPIAEKSLPCKGAVGTGISCGIDSLATVVRQSQSDLGSMQLTHLCFFDTGSHGVNTDAENASLRLDRLHLAQIFCNETGYPLVELRSNIHDVFYETYGFTHLYNSMAAVLAMQKLFSVYYYASGCTVWDFLSYTSDPAYLQPYLMQMLSTEATTFYMSEATMSRFEKTRLLSDNVLSQQFLNVCNVQGKNCGNCNKCIRTLLTLDIFGVLDSYREVFDVPEYQKNLKKHLAYHYLMCLKKDAIHLDIDKELIYRVPAWVKCLAYYRFIRSRCRLLLDKILVSFREASW